MATAKAMPMTASEASVGTWTRPSWMDHAGTQAAKRPSGWPSAAAHGKIILSPMKTRMNASAGLRKRK